MQILSAFLEFFAPRQLKTRHVCLVSYAEADKLLKAGEGWKEAPENDENNRPNMIYLERYI